MITTRRFAVLTCGGVCPGMNDVVRSIVIQSHRCGVTDVYGVPFGFKGLHSTTMLHKPLTPSIVDNIHLRGGSFLGTSRDKLDANRAVQCLLHHSYNALFVIGGNGGNTAAAILQDAVDEKHLGIQVIGLPKSIDNDIDLIDKCFGFDTAVHKAKRVLLVARNEADAVPQGIVVVKVMGRASGFIAHAASVDNDNVDVCLIPENPLPFDCIMNKIGMTFATRQSCVICVAEGFHMPADTLFTKVASAFPDGYCKYMDPSYLLRGGVTTPSDHEYCNLLGESAVDAALDGRKGVTVATKHGDITYFRTKDVIRKVKSVQIH